MKKPSPDPWNPRWDGPKELLGPLTDGQLWQTCDCGQREPAGGRCSRCGLIPGWQKWHKGSQTPEETLEGLLRSKNRSQGMSVEQRSVAEEVKK